MLKIGISGLSHLGIVTAIGLAEKGFPVVAWDPDLNLCRRLQKGDPIVSEPNLAKLLSKNQDKIHFTENPEDLRTPRIVYLTSDAPTNTQDHIEMAALNSIISSTVEAIDVKATLVLMCQVPPGFTRNIQHPKKQLFYQAETLVFGSALDRFLTPERFIVGCNDENSPVAKELGTILNTFKCPIFTMSYESAELAKIAINAFLTSQISATNLISSVCEKIDADWSKIAQILATDQRIGPHAYLKPGLGLSGGNLERDINVLQHLSSTYDLEDSLIDAWKKNSIRQKNWLIRQLEEHVFTKIEEPKIALLGLTYKENTHSIKNSPAIHLLSHIRSCKIAAHDPIARIGKLPFVENVSTPLKACHKSDVLIIATAWPEYRNLAIDKISEQMTGRLILDPMSVLKQQRPDLFGFHWIRLGSAAKLENQTCK